MFGVTLTEVPTTRPRYTLTDAGEVTEMLDLAERRWPEAGGRKELLMRLAAAGRDVVSRELAEGEKEERIERQRAAFRRLEELIDADVLLSDSAWR